MKKLKLKRLTLNELAEVMPVVKKEEQQACVGGGNGSSGNPYSWDEYDSLCDRGNWQGGYVEGVGYMTREATVSAGQQSCVFNVFAYFDSCHDASYYYRMTRDSLNCIPDGNGNIPSHLIPAIGALGGFNVTQLSYAGLTQNGCANGQRIIVDMNNNGSGHLVVVEGIIQIGRRYEIKCVDPTSNKSYSISMDSVYTYYNIR